MRELDDLPSYALHKPRSTHTAWQVGIGASGCAYPGASAAAVRALVSLYHTQICHAALGRKGCV